MALPLPFPGADGGISLYELPDKLRLPLLVALEGSEVILAEEYLGDILFLHGSTGRGRLHLLTALTTGRSLPDRWGRENGLRPEGLGCPGLSSAGSIRARR